MEREIIIKADHAAKCWTASHYLNGECDPKIVALFGTHTIPTAFTLQASADKVRAELARLNPGVAIEGY